MKSKYRTISDHVCDPISSKINIVALEDAANYDSYGTPCWYEASWGGSGSSTNSVVIQFNGRPSYEGSVTGITDECLLAIVIDRLRDNPLKLEAYISCEKALAIVRDLAASAWRDQHREVRMQPTTAS